MLCIRAVSSMPDWALHSCPVSAGWVIYCPGRGSSVYPGQDTVLLTGIAEQWELKIQHRDLCA